MHQAEFVTTERAFKSVDKLFIYFTSITSRVQAENEKFSPSTFRHGIDPKNDLAAFFQPPGIVFACPPGLLARLHKKWDKTTITR